MNSAITIGRSEPLRGRLRAPSDKSLTHRAIIFASLAKSPSVIHLPLLGEDCRATIAAFESMGVKAEIEESEARIFPAPLHAPAAPIDCGNSGTTIRLLAGVMAGLEGISSTLTGDASLQKRPMKRIADPLNQMGANVDGDTPPLRITGSQLRGIDYTSPKASAQIKSCILLAGLTAKGTTSVTEPSLSRDHTERMLAFLGVPIHRSGLQVQVQKAEWDGALFSIPSDISSAAFLLCAAALVPGSEVTLKDVGINPTRAGLLEVFQQAGVDYQLKNEREEMGEPRADITVRHTPDLKPFEISGDLVPRLIDEIPVLAVLASQCQGLVRIRDAEEARVKESDRLALVTDGLRKMGAEITEYPDGLDISGQASLHGAEIDAHLDHRIAMTFAVAAMIADGETTLTGADCIATSYPRFWEDMKELQS